MRRYLLTLMIVGLMFTAPTVARKRKADPALRDIHNLFVKGNNEAATNLRKVLAGHTSKLDNFMSGHGSQGGCFTLVGNADAADAVLEVSQERTSGGIESAAGTNDATTVVSGTLTDKQGNLVWSESKQGLSGLVHTGAGDAPRKLAEALESATGCK